MKTLVVTIAGPERKLDLTVPAETPIEQLMPTFVSLGVLDERAVNGDPVALAPPGSPPLPPTSTLAECGVVDGALLELQPLRPEERAEPEPKTITYEEFKEEHEQEALKRRAGFPLQAHRDGAARTRRASASALGAAMRGLLVVGRPRRAGGLERGPEAAAERRRRRGRGARGAARRPHA